MDRNMMSSVSYDTQLKSRTYDTQQNQVDDKVYIVYLTNMSDSQIARINEAQAALRGTLLTNVFQNSELHRMIRKNMRYFVIPCRQEHVIEKIKSLADKPRIFTARCVIECFKLGHAFPTKHLAISYSMFKCNIFLAQSCDTPTLRKRIDEMSGKLSTFENPELNVVVTDRADDKYCVKARARNVAVVSRDWVDDKYAMSLSEDHHVGHDALSSLSAYQIKPFLGLKFKINCELDKEIRDLISNNGGKLVFGNEDYTHVVAVSYPQPLQNQSIQNQPLRANNDTSDFKKPRVVDIEFLRECDRLGYYMNKRDYRAHLAEVAANRARVKQEVFTQPQPVASLQQNCFTPPQQNPQSTISSIMSNGCDRANENISMGPPSMPPKQRESRWDIDDVILKALASYDNATQHTQMPSTQMRSIPENDIRFERAPESSQQLFWNDSISRKQL